VHPVIIQKKTCDRNRPCQRCINRHQAHLCTERAPRKRKTLSSSTQHSETSHPPHGPGEGHSSQDGDGQSSSLPTSETSLELLPTKEYSSGIEEHTEQKVTFKRTLSQDRITISGKGKKIIEKFGPDSEGKWREIYLQTFECYKEELTQQPCYPIKAARIQIFARSIIQSKGINDPLSKTYEKITQIYQSSKEQQTKFTHTHPLANRFSTLLTLSQSPTPLPLKFELMSDSKIAEHNQAAICFSSEIITEGENHVIMELGYNMEAERLFGYSKLELFNLYKSRGKFLIARFIDPSEWEKVIQREIKAHVEGDTGFRLFITCVNKWSCPIKVLLDARFDCNNSPYAHRVNFFFIPLPTDVDIM